ncbi:molybdopterin-dependent oxidoreductase [Telmatospirillum siberiense]|uniref:Molybdopterin-binding protein n=1 Tax=Telmatospirillum siberiense TaxID=382514 RepID=A0A2N3PZ23_9PROT|nr:molybdopterin-dependent oxidoreductase [Telmatospirillum siberiense]PKU25662.1 molybdopterin-binding protein [Telmatospirillum siberiense]
MTTPRRRSQQDLSVHKRQVENLQRRLLLKEMLSLGALGMLAGCDLQDGDAVDKVLWTMSRWNDRVQAKLFSRTRLAPTYEASRITRPFPFNAFYPEYDAPDIDGAAFRLQLSGKIDDKRAWTLADLRALPQSGQITRHICIEGWSAIGEWRGVAFRTFLERIGADMTARYVGFKCADKYYSSLDMETAMHPQTLLALDFGADPLPAEYGFPLKLRVPTKLGFKNPKHIAEIFVTNDYPGGYWEDQGYNWFSGV